MDPDKVGKFIKKLRDNNNLTQQDLADKYNVTYQAVSKWERGINLPDISLLKQMSKDFNIELEDFLDGNLKTSKRKIKKIVIVIIVCILLIISIVLIFKLNDKNFNFKTLSSTCSEFKVSGSIAYDKDKSSIYISNVDYCGGNDTTLYKEIECNLYESNNDVNTKISSCKTSNDNIKLEDYLKNVELNIDNYNQTCKKYTDESLYLEINAKDKNDKITTYKIPLNMNNNCPK